MIHGIANSRRRTLPLGLTAHAIQTAVVRIEDELAELVAAHRKQIPKLSAIVGIFGCKALDSVSNYKKYRRAYTARDRFPDLCRRGCGPADPRNCLASKGSRRPWSVQSHFDHEGWYIIWRYLVDPTQSIASGKPVIVWRVDVVYLKKEDWKYEKSKAGEGGGGRTHTFGVKKAAAKLKGCAVYRRSDIVLSRGKPVPANGDQENETE